MADAGLSTIGLMMAAATSVSNVFKDVAGKKVLDSNEIIATTFWLRIFAGIGFALALFGRYFYFGTAPEIRDSGPLFGIEALHFAPLTTFLIYLMLDGIGVGLATLLYWRAIQVSPISVCVPFLAFTPIFLIPSGWLLLGELPPTVKLMGIVLVVIGSLVMHRQLFAISIFEPVRAIWRERGSRYVLIVAFIFCITNPLDKKLVAMSDPITQAFAYGIAVWVFFAGLAFFRKAEVGKVIRVAPKWLILAGALDALALILQFASHDYIDVVITISVKRAGIVLAVLLGWLIFKERGITDKIIASCVMLAGVLIIYLPLDWMQTGIFCAVTLIGMAVALYLTRGQMPNDDDLPVETAARIEGEQGTPVSAKNTPLSID